MSDSELDKSPISAKRAREASIGEEETVDPKDQLKIVTRLQEQYLEDNELWCLISKAWYTRWKQYCSRLGSPQQEVRIIAQQSHPGPINNKFILTNGELAEDLIFEDTVYGVPETAWNELLEWYGATPESIEPIKRLVITTDDRKTVELYPPQFKVYSVEASSGKSISQLERSPVITLSQNSLVTEFMSAVKNAFDLQESTEIQAWRLAEDPMTTNPNISVQLLNNAFLVETENDSGTLGNSGAISIAIEVKENDRYPSDQMKRQSDASSESSASSVFANGFNNLTTSSITTPPPSLPRFTRGVCGLQNLGNTCFMNSALQCLSNTPQLTKWFLADNYKKDLNRDNPLGMEGHVAEAYGELIQKLWSGNASSIVPRDFKYTIGRFNSSFSGYQQHDTQELLAFLLDGLHEDLNRIIKKPYIELPDFDGMKDTEIAKRSWDYHRARNDSVIVDLFQGQFKSRLICKDCKNVSVTFDPFMYLSLPLPIKKKSKVSIVYVPYDPSQQLQRVVVTLSKEASIAHLQKEVAKMMSVNDPNSLLIVELFNHKIYKVYPQYEPVANIGASDIIYVYQLPGPVPPIPKKKARYSYSRYSVASDDDNEEKPPIDENQLIVFPVYCATVTKNENTYSSNNERISQFGDPIILGVPHKDANKPELLYHVLSQHVERYTQFKLFEEVKENGTNPFLTKEETSSVDDEQPPGYESVMAEGVGESNLNTCEIEPSSNDGMDVDETQPCNNLIHTAAAVTPAGGKKIEPMSNLFAMKVFSAPRSYSRESDDLLPTVQNWHGLVDLKERAQAEQKQREEYMKQQNEAESDAEMEDSIVLPDTSTDQDDDQVEDAAALFGNSSSISMQEQADEDETEADDHYSMENASFHSDSNSDRFMTGKPLSPLIAPAPLATPVVPKRKLTCPPSTIIRQGEAILLEWAPKKAQQLFGSAHLHSNESGVCTDAWNDMHDLGDPNLDLDQTNQKKQVTLSDCLDEFTKEEELSEEDLWYCPKCKKHQQATKKFDLWRMPEIMVVHLKRFSHSRTWRDKIDALIDFPTSGLDLTERVLSIEDPMTIKDEDRLIYDLYAVDNHFGGLGGGHYTAYAQNFEDENWYNFDDSHVTKVDVSAVKTTAAYLLFYKRRRSNNDESTQSVEEIIREAKEKQQAAEDQQVVLLQASKTKDDDNHHRGYLAAADIASDDDQSSLEKAASPPVVLATGSCSKKTEDTTADLTNNDNYSNNMLDEEEGNNRLRKTESEEIL